MGPDKVTAICCDHYLKHNRKTRKELGDSAISPQGNHIDSMEQQFRLLREGQPILKPVYNHSIGDIDAPEYVKPAKYVIVEGLLPFHTRIMRLCFDVMVYLDLPEELRYKWKIKRDTTKRGYTEEQVRTSLAKRAELSSRYIYPQKTDADRVVRFSPPECHAEETGGHLNASLVLRPTLPHPDLSDVLEQSVNGTISVMRLELGRYEGKPVDFLEISGAVTADKAFELENLIQNHLPSNSRVDLDKLGRYQSGLFERRSCPLAF